MGFNFRDDDLILESRHNEQAQYAADMEAIRHELEILREAVNELQGIDPEKAGEPDE